MCCFFSHLQYIPVTYRNNSYPREGQKWWFAGRARRPRAVVPHNTNVIVNHSTNTQHRRKSFLSARWKRTSIFQISSPYVAYGYTVSYCSDQWPSGIWILYTRIIQTGDTQNVYWLRQNMCENTHFKTSIFNQSGNDRWRTLVDNLLRYHVKCSERRR